MKNTYQFAMVMATAALSAALLLAPAPVLGQAPPPAQMSDPAGDQAFEANARVLTVFDRQGKVVTTVGERALYNQPVFSPDRTRLAVLKRDLESDIVDLWVLDVATGNSTRITSNQTQEQERTRWPVWSPDGSQVSYVALRGGYWGLYRKASNGEGTEELLYQHPGGGMFLLDWSMDGRFLSFSTSDLSGGTLYALPLASDGERKPIEVFLSESQLLGSRISPDSRFLSYGSDQSGENEVYVRPFDPSSGAVATAAAGPWQVSGQGGGGQGAAFWRRDGKEMYYWAADRGLMVVGVSTAPTFTFGKPKLLFRLSEAVPVGTGLASVSRDGQRVVIAVPHAPTLQQITLFDRQGKVLSKVGEPGRYENTALSPDGTRVAVGREDPRTGNQDIWTFDVASGKGTPVTNDASPDFAPIWSPDGRQVAYVSMRGSFSSIYRKAWDGTGNEEHLFQYTPGALMVLTDWSADGKFLTFHNAVLMVVPLSRDQKALERIAIDWLRDEYIARQGRFSPDSRFMAYLSNEVETFEVYVRPFDASKPDVGAGGAKPVQVSTAGARGMIFWRQDGKELYYLNRDWEVIAVDVTTTPTFQAGTPRLLFKLPGPVARGGQHRGSNVSRDGQRLVFTIDVPVSLSAR